MFSMLSKLTTGGSSVNVSNQMVVELSMLTGLKREEMITREHQLSIVTRETEEIQPSCESLPQGPHVNNRLRFTQKGRKYQSPQVRSICQKEIDPMFTKLPFIIQITSTSFCSIFLLFSVHLV